MPETLRDDSTPSSALGAVSSSGITTTSTPRLACPYFKMHGHRGVRGKSCIGEGYPSLHRLKEHLYRVHGPSITCPRCYAEFASHSEVIDHVREEVICGLMPPPLIDETTTFAEVTRQELKRKPRRQGKPGEEEQCKDIYRILFRGESIPDSFYVDGDTPISRQEYRAELSSVMGELLVGKVPKEPKYAQLDSHLKAFLETARATGFLDEADHLVAQNYKRRRVAMAEPHSDISAKINDAVSGTFKSMEDVPTASRSQTTRESSQSYRLSESLHSRFSDDILVQSWSSEPLDSFDSAAVASFDLNPICQVNYGPDAESTQNYSVGWDLLHPESTFLSSGDQNEDNGVDSQDLPV